jgi:3D (Asp-Asp-Asp) domain-containing protein
MKRILSRSNTPKLVVMLVAIGGLMLAYEATTFDLLPWGGSGSVNPSAPVPGARLQFTATAYCKGTTTASGAEVRTGIAAADDDILPVGSVVNVTTDNATYNGVYTIMDTGPAVQGRLLDLYMWNCHEALAFGRKQIQITVLRLGWNPRASMPSLIDRLFRRRESAQPAPAPPPARRGTTAITTDGEEIAGEPDAAIEADALVQEPPALLLHESSTLSDPSSSPAAPLP